MKYAKILVVAVVLWLAATAAASAQSAQIWSASLTGSGACNGGAGIIKQTVFVAIFPGDGVVISLDVGFNQIIGVLPFVDVVQTGATAGVFSAVDLEGDPVTFVEVATGSFKFKTGNVAGFTALLQGVEVGCFIGGTLKSGKLLATM